MPLITEEKNPPMWFIIAGIIIISIAAVLVMLAPTKKYTPPNTYWLNGAQGNVINNLFEKSGDHFKILLPDERSC